MVVLCPRHEVSGWRRSDRCGAAKRETVRFEAAEMFGQGARPPEVARRLRVSRKSAYAWHAVWRKGGHAALASKGAGGFPGRLDDG